MKDPGTTHSGNGHSHASSRELQRDAAEIREEMTRTIDEIYDHLRPTELVRMAAESLRGGHTTSFFSNLSRTVSENPVPLVLIATGCGYMLYSDSQRRAQHPRLASGENDSDESDGGMGDRAQEAAEQGASRAREIAERGASRVQAGASRVQQSASRVQQGASRATQGAAHAASRAGETASAAGARLGDVGSRASGRARTAAAHAAERAADGLEGAGHALDRTQGYLQEQPMVMAGLGVAIGAALGSLGPVSQRETRLMGPAASDTVDELRHQKWQARESAKDAARDASGRARSEIRSAQDKLGAAAEDVGSAAKAASASVRERAERTASENRKGAVPPPPPAAPRQSPPPPPGREDQEKP